MLSCLVSTVGFCLRVTDTVCDGDEMNRMTRITDIVWMDMMIGEEHMVSTLLSFLGSINLVYFKGSMIFVCSHGYMIDSFVCFQGNITLGLFGEIAPLTVENLVGLMQGSRKNGNGYTGAIFHRVIHDFMMQVSHQNLKININYTRKHSSSVTRWIVIIYLIHPAVTT